MQFKGITGQVAFNEATGERVQSLSQPTYSVVNLLGADWQVRGFGWVVE